jgi:N6-adenosine-specific RNA methylase IME4
MDAAELARLAEEIRWHEAQATGDGNTALHHYAEAGSRLISAKARVGHSGWLPWLDREFEWKVRYAQYQMEWARLVAGKKEMNGFLPPGTGLIEAIRLVRGGAGGALEPAPRCVAVEPFNLPRNDYRIVLADPPWQYESWSGKSKDTSKRRVVEDEYDTMPLDAIKALPVGDICAEDAVLLLWATLPLLREALQVVEAWGFEYRTAFLVWGKLNADRSPAVGFGRYTRSNGELCLLGKRGDGVKPVPGVAVANLLLSQRGRHSQKPDEQYAIIDRVFGREAPRVELFARRRMPRWDVWGLEAPQHVSVLDFPEPARVPEATRLPLELEPAAG